MNDRLQLTNKIVESGLWSLGNQQRLITQSPLEPIAFIAQSKGVPESELLEQVAQALKIPFVNLRAPELANRIEWADFQREHLPKLLSKMKAIPLWTNEGIVTVASTNPYQLEIRKTLEFELGLPITIALAEESLIIDLLKRYYPTDGSLIEILEIPKEESDELSEDLDQFAGLDASSSPIIRLCNRLLADAAEQRASDIHFEPNEHGLEVRYRVDGYMHTAIEIPSSLRKQVISRMKLLARMDIAEKRKPQDGRFHAVFDKKKMELRVSSIPTNYGEKVVVRVLNTEAHLLRLDRIGFQEDLRNSLRRSLHRKDKLLLVCGPTGSGKTTTLYSCLSELNDGTRNITTIEDPVEYRLLGLNQIQVDSAIGVLFSNTLRSVLRQDPDVIMIGEIRDQETAELSINAAETGHLVLSTLHTNDALSTIFRLRNLGLKSYQIASVLEGVLAQRLIRVLCKNCKTSLDTTELIELKKSWPEHLHEKLSQAMTSSGCDACRHTGYSGRTILSSYLHITPKISDAIAREVSPLELNMIAKNEGYKSLEDSALEFMRLGVTSAKEVFPYIQLESSEFNDERKTKPSEPTRNIHSINTPSKPRQAKILIVEDDEDSRAILSMLLSKEHYQVIEARNGKQGLEAVFSECPDLVLCDLMMPEMNGKQFLSQLRAQPGGNTLPVLMLTAVDTSENECELLGLGARDFVGKGSPSEVILSRIRRALLDLQQSSVQTS